MSVNWGLRNKKTFRIFSKSNMAVRKKTSNPIIQESNNQVFEPRIEQTKSFWDKVGPLMVAVLIVAAFALGSMWTKISLLEKGLPTGGAGTQQQVAAQPDQVTVKIGQIKDLFKKNVVKFGSANAKNLLVEVGDPSCPYCHVAGGMNPELNAQVGAQFKLVSDGGTYLAPVPEMKKLVDSGKAAFVWIYTPGHGNGELGAKALYCAFDEGKFWQASDLLMSNKGYDLMNNQVKNDLAQADKLIEFLKPAISSGSFVNCVKSDKYKDRLAEETGVAGSLGVQGTPGFFVNETRFPGAYNWNDMKSAVK